MKTILKGMKYLITTAKLEEAVVAAVTRILKIDVVAVAKMCSNFLSCVFQLATETTLMI